MHVRGFRSWDCRNLATARASGFGGPGWTLDETTGQYYFHNHLQEQPDMETVAAAGRWRR